MDILEYLKKRQSELEYKSHPMSDKDDGFKYLYCYGLGVMAVGNLKAVTELQSCFETMLDSICISQKSRSQIIVDINNYFDFRIAEFLKKFKAKKHSIVLWQIYINFTGFHCGHRTIAREFLATI